MGAFKGMKVLELDIETAPHIVYVWGLFNQNVAINQIVKPGRTICWAAKWQHQKGIKFRSIWTHGHDKMVEDVYALLEEADVVVHYNGKKFDIPTLQREFVLMGKTPPDDYHQIDLYHTVRRQFKFASNKLDFVSQQLGLGNKTQHKGMDLWTGVMDGNKDDQKTMKAYNIQDVNLLEKLYYKLQPWITNHPNRALWMEDSDEPTCPTCGSHKLENRGIRRTNTQKYRRYKCNNCGANPRERLRLEPAKRGVLKG
jgi:DNA polymerase elongation subunit (family B)/predicted RNA-binding Zn-ribbon protein involved in translation (DUF1610 family)